MSRFRIISKLGSGGFGEAFRAWDSQQGVPVVLKRPLAKHLNRPDVLARFHREITRLLELPHPHIVPIIDHGFDPDGRPFLAMRFLPAGSLADRKKPHSAIFLQRWLPGVAAALDYVHAHGVVHRDVKPANIFFDTQNIAYLGDFGIAKIINDDLARESEQSLTSTGGEVGTYPYMAPEFFQKPRVLAGTYDQYALAVTVYEMICGRRPFSGDSGQLIAAHVTQKPPDIRRFRPDAPATLCEAVTRALSKLPADRFGKCADFADAALRGVSAVAFDDSVRRFLCPGCHNLVKVPTELSGRNGRCTDCGAHLRISDKLDALWLKQEDPSSSDGPRSIAGVRTPENHSATAAAEKLVLRQRRDARLTGSAGHDKAAEGSHSPPENTPKSSPDFTNEGDINAAYSIYQEALPLAPNERVAEQSAKAKPVVSVPPYVLLGPVQAYWQQITPVGKALGAFGFFVLAYVAIVNIASSRHSPTPGSSPIKAVSAGNRASRDADQLTAAAALEITGTHEGPLFLKDVTALTEESAAVLANYRGDVHLPRISALTLRSAQSLASHEGWLGLNGVVDLSAGQLQALATHNGTVSLLGLRSIPAEAVAITGSANTLLIPMHLLPASTDPGTPSRNSPRGDDQ